jgi:NRPS condensation-like uncharacterized protein
MSSNPTSATAAFRLSPQQERAWSQQERGLHTYAQCVIGLEGRLDTAKLQKSLTHAVSKYEILRTVLRHQAGIKLPFQVIQETPSLQFEQAQAPGIGEILPQGRGRPASAMEGPTLRAVLAARGPDDHTLVLTLPAFCADAATLKNLAAEIGAAYGSDGSSADSDVIQYADLV